MKYDTAQIIFVTETNDMTESDDCYIRAYLRMYFAPYLHAKIKYDFVHMDGYAGYKSKKVVDDVRNKLASAYDKTVAQVVVYCFDRDHNSVHKLADLKEYESYCEEKGYKIVYFCKNIEDAFGVKVVANKQATAKEFLKKQPSPKTFPRKQFKYSLDFIKQTNIPSSNLDNVIQEIISMLTK